MTARDLMPIAEYNAHSAPGNQGGGRECSVNPSNHTNSGTSSSVPDSPVALLSSCVRGGNSASDATAIPASLALFLHEFLGERAVMRETVKKAAPAFRRFQDEF
jgi:hypothetical protein